MADDTCGRCGARLFGVDWCGQCGARQTGSSVPVAGAVLRPAGPPAPVRYSRWESTPTTFGPVLKIVLTVVLIAFPLTPGLLAMSGGMAPDPLLLAGDGGVWFLIAFILRSLWRRGQVT